MESSAPLKASGMKLNKLRRCLREIAGYADSTRGRAQRAGGVGDGDGDDEWLTQKVRGNEDERRRCSLSVIYPRLLVGLSVTCVLSASPRCHRVIRTHPHLDSITPRECASTHPTAMLPYDVPSITATLP